MRFSLKHLNKFALLPIILMMLLVSFSAKASQVRYGSVTPISNAALLSDTATIDVNLNIVLIATGETNGSYTADISKLNFGDEQAAVNFFTRYSDNVVVFTVNYAAKQVQIKFPPAADGAHDFVTLAERNAYLKDKLLVYKKNLQSN